MDIRKEWTGDDKKDGADNRREKRRGRREITRRERMADRAKGLKRSGERAR